MNKITIGSLPILQEITDLLEQQISTLDVEQSEARATCVFSPSSIGTLYPCDAKLAYGYLGAPKDARQDTRKLRIMQNGSYVHHRIQDYLARAFGDKFRPEVPVEIPELYISGTCDGILEYNGRRVVEIKSINDSGFRKLKSPHAEHVTQVTCYMKGAGASSAIFIYENKDTQEWTTFLSHFNDELWAVIEKQITGIINLIAEGGFPLWNRGFYCKDCDFRVTCQENSNGIST